MRTNGKKIVAIALTSFLLSLVSCSASSSSSAAHTVTFTVTFLDDAGNEVGFKYVHYGENIEYATPKTSSGTLYDFKSKSSTSPSVGHRLGFTKWEGVYGEGAADEVGAYDSSSRPAPKTDGTEAVDPANIKGACTVKAVFAEAPLRIKTLFKNGSATIFDTTDPAITDKPYTSTLEWGATPSASYFPADPTTEAAWGHSSTFGGYLFSTKTGVTPSKASGIYYHGSGDPSLSSTTVYDASNVAVTAPLLGALYEDVSTYTLYGYDGAYAKIGVFDVSAWASSSSALTVTYYASYKDASLDFTSKFYSSKADFDKRDDATTPSSPLGSMKSCFAKTIAFDLTLKKVSGTDSQGTAVSFDYSALGEKVIRKWAGVFDKSTDSRNIYSTREVGGDYAIMANASFYPLFSDQEVIVYPSKAKAVSSFPTRNKADALSFTPSISGLTSAYAEYGTSLSYTSTASNSYITASDAEGRDYVWNVTSLMTGLDHWEILQDDGAYTLGSQSIGQDVAVYPVY